MTDEEAALLATARLDDAWPIVELFSTIRREHPDEVNRAADAIVARLRAHGVPVTVHEPLLYLALPKSGGVVAEGRRLHARPAPLSRSVPEGIEAPLAYVADPVSPPAGWAPSTADLFGPGYDPAPGTPDLRGRIAIYHGMISSERIMGFHQLGAVGVVAVNPGAAAHWGGGSPIWGTPDLDDLPHRPAIPGVSVSRPDGAALIALAARGGSARIVTELEEGWFRSKLPVVEIPGTTEPEKFVLLHGHYDSWDVGVGDNATGDACMLEVARALWEGRAALRRSVRVAWWPGHSTGRFAGSTWYADAFALDLARNCVAHLNCDSPGCRDATDYHLIPWMAENTAFVTGVVRDVADRPAAGKRPTQSSDFSFNNLGITGMFSASSRIPKEEVARRGWYYVMGNGGNLEWHTDDDRLPVADRDVLLRDIRVYLLAVARLATLPVLPLDWRALLAEFARTLDGYARAAGDRFDLGPAVAAIADLDAAVARLDAAIAGGAVRPAAANAARLALSRALVPLNYARGTRWRRDLGLPAPPLTALAVAAELDRYPPAALPFALTTLRRGLNHVLAALEEGREAVEAALRTGAAAHVGGRLS